MLNVGGGEFLVILLVALIVLGPQKLPEAARQVGHFAREIRKMSNAFQAEMREAMDDPIEAAAKDRGRKVVASEQVAAPEPAAADGPAASDTEAGSDDAANLGDDDADVPEADVEAAEEPPEPVSTAEAAGMYDITAPEPAHIDDEDDHDDHDDGDDE